MKFGLESEKFLFDVHTQRPSKGVFRFLDALSDFESLGADLHQKITNEFVMNMIELGTDPSSDPMDVIREYLFNHLLVQAVAQREYVALVSMGSMPMDYQPHMLPKWPYFVQNSILDSKKQKSWMMDKNSPLLSAGNCAGVHVHSEVETPPEFLFSNRELQDKFNMGLMMTPLIAFSSSPYFFGKHKASSMRGLRYFYQVYKKFPLNGALPPVMNSSADVLSFIQSSVHLWKERGAAIGLDQEDLHRLTLKKGANWNPLRWNRQWNTIELRCLDSDRIDLDCSKFIWVVNAMKRMDLQGENLETTPLPTRQKVDRHMLDECLQVSGRKVSILSSAALEEIFMRAVIKGTKDDLVEHYLYRLADFSKEKMDRDQLWIHQILKRVLESHQTTSQKLLAITHAKPTISGEVGVELVNFAIDDQKKIMKLIKKYVPEVIEKLRKVEKLNP